MSLLEEEPSLKMFLSYSLKMIKYIKTMKLILKYIQNSDYSLHHQMAYKFHPQLNQDACSLKLKAFKECKDYELYCPKFK